MTRRQAKIFAKIHSATMIGYIDAFAFMGHNGEQTIPEKDQEKMIEAVCELANKIKGELPEIADTRDIYKYVIANF